MNLKGRRQSKNVTDLRRTPEQVRKDKIDAINSMYLDPLPTKKKNPEYYDDPSRTKKGPLPNYTDLPLNSKTKK